MSTYNPNVDTNTVLLASEKPPPSNARTKMSPVKTGDGFSRLLCSVMKTNIQGRKTSGVT